jgi:hypothetical protein
LSRNKGEIKRSDLLDEPIFNNFDDRLQYSLSVLKNTSIPETGNVPSISRHIVVPHRIMAAVCMLAAVNLDDEMGLSACEISEVPTYR